MKPTLHIVRDVDAPELYTLGHFEDASGRELCKTLEEPWRDNKHNVSRILDGTYSGFLRKSHLNGGTGQRDYDVPELIGVPGRLNIQIHIGNTLDDTLGCILVGRYYGELRGKKAVLGSAPAFTELLPLFGKDGFTLVVKNQFGCRDGA